MPPNWTPGAKFDLIQIPTPQLPPWACCKFTASQGCADPCHSSSLPRRNDKSPWSNRRSPIPSKTRGSPSAIVLPTLCEDLIAKRRYILQEGLMASALLEDGWLD